MGGNTVTLSILPLWGLIAMDPESGQQEAQASSKWWPTSRSTASGNVTVRRDEGTIPQRAEEPVPVSLSPPMTAEQADLARRFRGLMLPHLDAAYNLARYLLRDPVAAEDVAQDAFLRAFRAFEGYRGGDPKAWILAIVRNCCCYFDIAPPDGSSFAMRRCSSSVGSVCCANVLRPASLPALASFLKRATASS